MRGRQLLSRLGLQGPWGVQGWLDISVTPSLYAGAPTPCDPLQTFCLLSHLPLALHLRYGDTFSEPGFNTPPGPDILSCTDSVWARGQGPAPPWASVFPSVQWEAWADGPQRDSERQTSKLLPWGALGNLTRFGTSQSEFFT